MERRKGIKEKREKVRKGEIEYRRKDRKRFGNEKGNKGEEREGKERRKG